MDKYFILSKNPYFQLDRIVMVYNKPLQTRCKKFQRTIINFKNSFIK